jgi:hypothetical protein
LQGRRRPLSLSQPVVTVNSSKVRVVFVSASKRFEAYPACDLWWKMLVLDVTPEACPAGKCARGGAAVPITPHKIRIISGTDCEKGRIEQMSGDRVFAINILNFRRWTMVRWHRATEGEVAANIQLGSISI